jgi:hypothetical protein
MRMIYKIVLSVYLLFTALPCCYGQTVWTIWQPTDKLANELLSIGYELKSISFDNNSGWEFGYLEKGASVFRCALVLHDLRFITIIDKNSYKCAELKTPFQSEGKQ